jgi:hypothetical protein
LTISVRAEDEAMAEGAGTLGVGVGEFEAGAFQAFDEIDGGPGDERLAGGVDEDLHRAVVDDGILGTGRRLQFQSVLKTGAAAARYLDAQTRGRAVRTVDEAMHRLDAAFSQGNHGSVSSWKGMALSL